MTSHVQHPVFSRGETLPHARLARWTGTLLVGTVIGLLDLVIAIVYWNAQDVGPERVLGVMSSWVLGAIPDSMVLATVTALLVQTTIYGTAATLLDAAFRRSAGLRTHVALSGAVWGVLTFFVAFVVVVPMLVHPRLVSHDPQWMMVCLLAHAAVLGPLGGTLLARRAEAGAPALR